MAEEGPSKSDINAVFKKLRALSSNKICFDCGAKNPTWASVTYGVFICIDCSAVHRGLGVHVSFVRSSQLDTNWTWLQLRAMQCGGNNQATQFFRQHGCTTSDSHQKYKSRGANLYREKLHHSAVQAMRLHGTKIHLDPQLSPTPQETEVDFFEEHTDDSNDIKHNMSAASLSDQAYIIPPEQDDEDGPSVPDNLDSHSHSVAEQRKVAAIGQRKPQAKKAGFGVKKGGMGAQKVRANFSEIEQKAETIDKEREEASRLRFQEQKPKGDEDNEDVQKLSSRLMVQDITKEREKAEEKAKSSDPKKVDQVERLGMGFQSKSSGVSHSIGTDMKAIKQEGIRSKTSAYKNKEPEDDDWEIIKEPGRPSNDFYDNAKSRKDEDEFGSKANSNDFFNSWEKDTWKEERRNGGTSRSRAPAPPPSYESSASEEAQKKFGGAKAISSDQFFGNQPSADYETRANLTKFEGSTGISSSDYFGDDTAKGASTGSYYSSYSQHVPDMTDVKDSVRHGVSKVAGKLSNISSSVSGYISDRYSGY